MTCTSSAQFLFIPWLETKDLLSWLFGDNIFEVNYGLIFPFLLFQWIQRNYARRLFGNENNVVFPRNSCKVNTSTSAICNGWVNSKVEQKWRGLLSVPISCTNPILSLPYLNHATVQTMKGWSVSLMARID